MTNCQWLRLIQLLARLMITSAAVNESVLSVVDQFFQYQCSSSEGCPCNTVCEKFVSTCADIKITSCMSKCHEIKGRQPVDQGTTGVPTVSDNDGNCSTPVLHQSSTHSTWSWIAAGAIGFVICLIGFGGTAIACPERFRQLFGRGKNAAITSRVNQLGPNCLRNEISLEVGHHSDHTIDGLDSTGNPATDQQPESIPLNSQSDDIATLGPETLQNGSPGNDTANPFAERLETFPVKGRGVFAVARMNSKIFLLQTEDDTIQVYADSHPYKESETLKIEGMINPSDMLACEDNQSLYVTDDAPHPGFKMQIKATAGCLWRIRLGRKQSTDDKLLFSEKDWRPRALSRTSNGNILITTKHDDCRIYICDLHGSVLEILIPPPQGIFDPEHVIEVLPNDFVVCHRIHKGDNSMHQIVKLKRDVNTETLDSSCSQGTGTDPTQNLAYAKNPQLHDDLRLDRPLHMVRLPDNRILVADHYNDRVLLLLPDFKLQAILIQSTKNDRFTRPCRLQYDAKKHELLVAFHHNADLFKLTLSQIPSN